MIHPKTPMSGPEATYHFCSHGAWVIEGWRLSISLDSIALVRVIRLSTIV
jgi:hypothetical protein